MIKVSEIFSIEDLVAFSKDLISLSSQVKLLANIAHIEQLLAVFLEQQWSDIKVCGGSCNE